MATGTIVGLSVGGVVVVAAAGVAGAKLLIDSNVNSRLQAYNRALEQLARDRGRLAEEQTKINNDKREQDERNRKEQAELEQRKKEVEEKAAEVQKNLDLMREANQ